MADNTQLNVGTLGDIISSDVITTLNGGAIATGEKAQRVKVGFGSDSVFRDVDASNGLPTNIVSGAIPANTTASGTLSASDAVVAAPVGDGSLISGASTAGSIVAIAIPSGYVAWNLLIKSYVSGTIYTEGSSNSTNGTDGDWTELKGRKTGTAVGVESVSYAQVANGYYRGNAAGFTWIRARLIGGTAPTILWTLSAAQGATFLNSGIPAGGSIIGKVGIDQTTPGTTNLVALSAETTKVIGTVTVGNASLPVTGTFFQATQPVSAASLPLPTGASTETTLAALNTKVTAVNTGAVTISTALPAGANNIGSVRLTDGTNLNTIKAASTASVAADTAQVVALHPTSPLPAGANLIGSVTFNNAAATAKGTQGANGIPTQDLKDAGRTIVAYYTVIPVLTTAIDTLQSLTGTKAGTIAATTTPAVVTTAKKFRITSFTASYIATATSGYAVVTLRFNGAAVVAITSPVASSLVVGSGAPATANATATTEGSLPEGLEIPAGGGVGISVQGFAGVTATAVGYVMCSVSGYEY